MKTLTLTQPWATLVIYGFKKYETRSWATSYRGPLAIHAAKGLADMTEAAFLALCEEEPFRSALLRCGYEDPAKLPRGAVLGQCELTNCLAMAGLRGEQGTGPKYADWVHALSARERAFGNYAPERYGFRLASPVAYPEPIPARGKLGLWEWNQ